MDPNFKHPITLSASSGPATNPSGSLVFLWFDAASQNLAYRTAAGQVYHVDTGLGTALPSLTSNWQNTYTTVQNNSASNWSYQGTDLKSLSANWENTYTTVNANSASWGSGPAPSPPTLSFNESTAALTISPGNTVSLSSLTAGSASNSALATLSSNWQNTYTTVQNNSASNWSYQGTDLKSLSANWQNTYTTVQNNSASNWSYQGTDLKILSANWQNTYTTVQNNSASNWDNSLVTSYVNSGFLPLSGGTLSGSLSVLGDLVYIDTAVAVVSTMYIDTSAPNEPALRITQRGSGDVIRVEDSSNPDSTPFLIDTDGAVGIGTSTPNQKLTVVGNVSATGAYYGDGSNLTGIVAGDTVATTLVRSNSAFWQNTYTTVQSNSASNWSYQGTDLKDLSANWQNTYTTVQSNSASNWSYQGTDLKSLSANWQNTYTTVQSNSASKWTSPRCITFVFDGGGSAPPAGTKVYVRVPTAGTITKATLLADVAGTATLDVWKDTYDNYPPTVADTITASAKPAISSALKYQDTTLSGWTTSLNAGDILACNIDSCSTATRLTLQLEYSL